MCDALLFPPILQAERSSYFNVLEFKLNFDKFVFFYTELTCTLEQLNDMVTNYTLRNGTAPTINDTAYGFGAVVEVQCAEGYYVEGVISAYCMGGDGWNLKLGTCESKCNRSLIIIIVLTI